MAKNITWLGASYSNVKDVELPQTGGGTATFSDASVTTAVAGDVAQGKIFLSADGTPTEGTSTGGGGGGGYVYQDQDGYVVLSPDGSGGGGGGVDMPTFTIDWNDGQGDPIVTCDKTFAQCSTGDSGGAYIDARAVDVDDSLFAGLLTDVDSSQVVYTFYDGSFPYFDIVYESDGTLTLNLPSSAIDVLNVTQNGTYYPEKVLTEVNVNVPTGGGGGAGGSYDDDVAFIDYDGTVLHSYSASDFANLSAMPSNPSHTGLTAQGWNWSLADAKAQVTAMGRCVIGQLYVTSDDKTRLYCRFEKGRLHPYLGLCPNGTVTVDWGDNSSTDTLTGTSLTTPRVVDHVYAKEGSYIITLSMTSGTFAFYGASSTSYVLRKADNTTANIHYVYSCALHKVELGSAARIGDSAFYGCENLESISIHEDITIAAYAFAHCSSLLSITVPDGRTLVNSYTYQYCYSLERISLPYSTTSVNGYAFQYCYSLGSIIVPDKVTSIGTNTFYNCYSLQSFKFPSSYTYSSLGTIFRSCRALSNLTIPDVITTVPANAFNSNYGMAEFHFLSETPPTLSATSAFTGIPSDCIIYVPYSADHSVLNAYKTANNWSTYASYMQEEGT